MPRKDCSVIFICGGVIKESEFKKRLKSKDGVYGIMMCWVLPDDKYEEWERLHKKGKHEEARQIFDKYAKSII